MPSKRASAKKATPSKKAAPVATCQLKLTLTGIQPPIWRRMQVPGNILLSYLHHAFQVAMGWSNSHLHQFEKDGKIWGVPEHDEFDEIDLTDEDETQLSTVLGTAGESMTYVYDFGDDWRHTVVLEKIIPPGEVAKNPICLDGERHCPPEDVGGPIGYQQFLDVIFDPTHEDFHQMVDWAGGPFQAEEFDRKAVNEVLARMRWPAGPKR